MDKVCFEPGLDALVADPRLVAKLSPEVAQKLLFDLAAIYALLVTKAWVGNIPRTAERDSQVTLTPRQVATRLNVKESLIYSMARERKLPCLKIGKYIRFKESSINAYLEKCGLDRNGIRYG